MATLDTLTSARFAGRLGLSAASLLRPPSALLHYLLMPEVIDFVRQRLFADSGLARLVVGLTPRLPTR